MGQTTGRKDAVTVRPKASRTESCITWTGSGRRHGHCRMSVPLDQSMWPQVAPPQATPLTPPEADPWAGVHRERSCSQDRPGWAGRGQGGRGLGLHFSFRTTPAQVPDLQEQKGGPPWALCPGTQDSLPRGHSSCCGGGNTQSEGRDTDQ